jgi:hypothetical protein
VVWTPAPTPGGFGSGKRCLPIFGRMSATGLSTFAETVVSTVFVFTSFSASNSESSSSFLPAGALEGERAVHRAGAGLLCCRRALLGQGSVTKFAGTAGWLPPDPAGGPRSRPRLVAAPLCNLLVFRIVLGASATERGSR